MGFGVEYKIETCNKIGWGRVQNKKPVQKRVGVQNRKPMLKWDQGRVPNRNPVQKWGGRRIQNRKSVQNGKEGILPNMKDVQKRGGVQNRKPMQK